MIEIKFKCDECGHDECELEAEVQEYNEFEANRIVTAICKKCRHEEVVKADWNP